MKVADEASYVLRILEPKELLMTASWAAEHKPR